MTDVFFGDSITIARDPTMGPWGIRYPEVYQIIHNTPPPLNRAVGGTMAADQAFYGLLQHVPTQGDRHFYMICTNDWFFHDDTTPVLMLFEMTLGAQVTHLAGNKKACRSHPDWAFSGSWVNTWSPYSSGSFGMSTRVQGDIAEIDFTGDWFDLVYSAIDTSTSGIDIYVDGVFIGTQPIGPPYPVLTALAHVTTPVLYHKEGFGPGTHHLRLVSHITTNGHIVSLEWLGDGSNGIPLYLLSSPRANLPNAERVISFNACKAVVAANAQAKGMNVTYVDACAAINPLTDVCVADVGALWFADPGGVPSWHWMANPQPDNSHLNSYGHVKVAVALPPP